MLTIQDILLATSGRLLQGNNNQKIVGVSIDSRTVGPSQLFIAIAGERFDGHQFVSAALKRGAKALVVSKKIKSPLGISVILVKDTTKALGHIAKWHRQRFDIPVVAITGSAGKTSTKEMTAHLLSGRYNVLKNVKTENNQFGVPLTLLKLNPKYDIAVLELGTNQPGDIAWLAEITQPNIAVFTNIGPSHLERLKSSLGVYQEKIQLLQTLHEPKRIVYNHDDPLLRRIDRLKGYQKITFGTRSSADYRARLFTPQGQEQRFRLGQRRIHIPSTATHDVYNALAAIAVARHFQIPLKEISAAFERFQNCAGRQTLSKIGSTWLIDDTYNANPLSYKSAIQTLNQFGNNGARRIIVCSDMLELGKQSRHLHEQVGRDIARSRIDCVLSYGRLAKHISSTVKKLSRQKNVFYSLSLDDIHQRIRDYVHKGDVILVKGSRSMHMERTVNFIQSVLKGA